MNNNYLKIILSSTIFSSAIGFMAPFLNLYLIQKAGISNYGYLVGGMLLAGAIASYFTGVFSDTFGRKFPLIFSHFFTACIIVGYLFTTSLAGLYLMQILLGILSAAELTLSMSLLGDFSSVANRGHHIGLYNALSGAVMGIMVIIGGSLVSKGVSIIFIISASLICISGSLLTTVILNNISKI